MGINYIKYFIFIFCAPPVGGGLGDCLDPLFISISPTSNILFSLTPISLYSCRLCVEIPLCFSVFTSLQPSASHLFMPRHSREGAKSGEKREWVMCLVTGKGEHSMWEDLDHCSLFKDTLSDSVDVGHLLTCHTAHCILFLSIEQVLYSTSLTANKMIKGSPHFKINVYRGLKLNLLLV